tara:strand:- start:1440 stop:1700 length:261 start_codon:yes stop_codon:yes gene_type:complete
MRLLLFILLTSSLFSQPFCPIDNQIMNRSLYSIGDTLSIEDQNMLFPVCNGSGNYSTGDSFSFSDLDGDLNGGDYKITLISMNATW